MNRQAWRDFFITVFFLGVAFLVALLSSVAADQRNTQLATIAAAVSLVLALLGALYIIPRLARNVRLEILRFAIRTTVTVEGLLFIVFLVVIGFAAWNTGNNLLYLILSAMMAFLIAANLIGRVSLAGVAVQLRFPDHIYAGESASISVTLLNHKRWLPSYSVLVEALSEPRDARDAGKDDAATRRRGDAEKEEADHRGTIIAASPRPRVPASLLPPPLEIGKLAYFVLVPAGASGRHRIERTFKRRGRYPITGFRLATKFPAGFFKKWRRIDARGELIVYPKPEPLSDFYHSLPMLAGRVQSRVRGSGDDLYAIRRYQTSDHLRNIDWKATAKAQQMMVREHTREDEWRLTIVFDTMSPVELAVPPTDEAGKKKRRDAAAAEPDEERQQIIAAFQEKFERAIVQAASLANHFILERAEVELITSDERYNVGSGAGYDQLYKILRVLATLQPTTDATEAEAGVAPRAAGQTAWRLLDEMPVLGDERRFKVLITSAAKGTIPAHIWRSAHVVFMDDL
ncbi:MAG TPA: DUF58 domain-containing protein [Blastocatellia bacterium]|nr:DUF58 domain-containing protein [Blastocatellia bacterium]